MKRLLTLSVLGLSFFLFSCVAYVGNESLKGITAESMSTRIVKNRSTKGHVLAQFGKPEVKATNADGESIWGYQLIEIMQGQEEKQLVIIFGKNGKVKDYSFIEG